MTQPKFAPISIEDEMRPSSKLESPRPWVSHRPGEFRHGKSDPRKGLGVQGPDQGYALRVARKFVDKVELEPDEDRESALAGAVAIGLARASRFGRAPVGDDIEFALTLFGFLGAAPLDLVAFRKPLFRDLLHDYWQKDALVSRIPFASLSMSPSSVRQSIDQWRSLIDTSSAGDDQPGNKVETPV